MIGININYIGTMRLKYIPVVLLSAVYLFLFSFNITHAEVTQPYTVDEKPQVLFADSVATSTYLVLENYTQDYVGDYAHIKFTYTHRDCCYSVYPPIIHVSSLDPRLNLNPYFANLKSAYFAYFFSETDPSDWYSVDIQFDPTGYQVVVKRAGITEVSNLHTNIVEFTDNDWVYLANNYPISNPPLPYSMSFTPIPVKVVPPVGNSNVLFIPGLEASRLYEPTSVVGDGANQLWEPNKNADVDLLHFLDNNGQKIDTSIYTGDIIKEVNIIGTNIYKSFSNMMDGLMTQGEIADWQAHAYDWRDSVTSIVNNGTQYLNEVITLESRLQDLALTSDSGKVTVIAHSNGGLVAKALIKKLQDDKVAGLNNLIDKIDKLILVAVPQLGTPTAIPALLHGYDQDLGLGFIMNKATARAFGVTMPGAYGLLPSPEYFNKVFTPVISFLPNIADPYMNQEISLYGNTIDSYSELGSFLAGGDGRPDPGVSEIFKPIKLRSSLLDSEKVMHSQIDNLVIPSNIEVIEIAGWGLVTVSGFEYSAPKLCQYPTDNNCTGTYFIDQRPVFVIDGDKTVVTASALAGSGEKWWVNINKYNFLRLPRIGHASILEVTPLLDFILSKITDYSFTDTTYISTSIPNYNGNYLKLSVHSPVTLDAYDVDGNHTGKICPPNTDLCYVEENILNSSYLEFGEGKYINLPEDEFSRVSLQGTGIGTFTYESEKVLADGTLTTSTFVDIPVTTQTQAEITLNQSTGILELKLDVTGDGVIDFTLAPSDTFDPITYLQIMKVTIDSLDIPQAKKKAFSKRIDNTIKLIEKGKIDKAKLRADKFKSVLESFLGFG